jgi:hypothetical protein
MMTVPITSADLSTPLNALEGLVVNGTPATRPVRGHEFGLTEPSTLIPSDDP